MITATIVGDQQVIDQLGIRGERAKVEMRQVVDLMAMKTLARVKMKLSDDVLHVRTGRLRRSITQTVTEDGNTILGTVGTNVIYGRYHELGFKGQQSVKETMRTIKTAWGKAIKGGPVTFPVRAHTRQVNYPARSFLATSLAELAPKFRAEVAVAAAKVFAK